MSQPAVSIIVPAFNRPVGLRRCVCALLVQTMAEIEIIVVDDAGTPPAGEVLGDVNDPRLRVMRQDSNKGPAAARNRGAREAKGERLAFTDDDCAPRPDWVERLVATHVSQPAAMVGGVTVNGATIEPHAEASQRLIDCLYDRLNLNAHDANFLTSNNMMVSAGDFAAVGGFDENYSLPAGEDRAFCRTWRASGRPMMLERAAIIDHFHAMTFRGFWRQHFNYGQASWHYHRTVPTTTTTTTPPTQTKTADSGRVGSGFALNILAHPMKHGRGQSALFRLRVATLLALSQAATVAGSLAAWRKGRGDG